MDNQGLERWFVKSTKWQITNVGCEVQAAIRAKNKGEDSIKIEFYNSAIKFLKIISLDPKNKDMLSEFEYRIKELEDYFLGDNLMNTTDDKLIEYYEQYAYDEDTWK